MRCCRIRCLHQAVWIMRAASISSWTSSRRAHRWARYVTTTLSSGIVLDMSVDFTIKGIPPSSDTCDREHDEFDQCEIKRPALPPSPCVISYHIQAWPERNSIWVGLELRPSVYLAALVHQLLGHYAPYTQAIFSNIIPMRPSLKVTIKFNIQTCPPYWGKINCQRVAIEPSSCLSSSCTFETLGNPNIVVIMLTTCDSVRERILQ